MMYTRFHEGNFRLCCRRLAKQDNDLKNIITEFGYPQFWTRKPGFATLIHIILEQQVSLASASAALKKLEARLGTITPAKLIALNDSEMKACYFSRQKTRYARNLADAVLSRRLKLPLFETASDQIIKEELTKISGIGSWTADVYLMMALHRTDCFPMGDIALLKSLKSVKRTPEYITRESLGLITDGWRPFRTIAAFLLWHAYICKRQGFKEI
ncbi:MAG: DNA-3-methyladenine glycosylase 2 family protein [Chitinophagaceae bacterium]